MNPYAIFLICAIISALASAVAVSPLPDSQFWSVPTAVFSGLTALVVPIMKTLEEGRASGRSESAHATWSPELLSEGAEVPMETPTARSSEVQASDGETREGLPQGRRLFLRDDD
jgi:hypothetical protein